MLHQSAVRSDIESRVKALRADSRGRWGKMSVDQMLWHVNQALAAAVGDETPAPMRVPVPKALAKFIVLRLPWVKGAPTHPQFVATASHDFLGQRDRCLGLIEKLAAKPLDDPWPAHPAFGPVTGREMSRLQAKHLDHHLKQFGA